MVSNIGLTTLSLLIVSSSILHLKDLIMILWKKTTIFLTYLMYTWTRCVNVTTVQWNKICQYHPLLHETEGYSSDTWESGFEVIPPGMCPMSLEGGPSETGSHPPWSMRSCRSSQEQRWMNVCWTNNHEKRIRMNGIDTARDNKTCGDSNGDTQWGQPRDDISPHLVCSLVLCWGFWFACLLACVRACVHACLFVCVCAWVRACLLCFTLL